MVQNSSPDLPSPLVFAISVVTSFRISFSAFGICNQRCHELQDILLTVDIGEGIVVHAFAEVDGVEHLNLILSDGLKGIAAFHQDTAFWICHNIRTVHLKEVRFQPEPGLTGTGAADNQDVLVPRCCRILGTVAHGQSLRCRQDHVERECPTGQSRIPGCV